MDLVEHALYVRMVGPLAKATLFKMTFSPCKEDAKPPPPPRPPPKKIASHVQASQPHALHFCVRIFSIFHVFALRNVLEPLFLWGKDKRATTKVQNGLVFSFYSLFVSFRLFVLKQ